MKVLRAANIPNSRNSGMGRVMHLTTDELRTMGHSVDLLFSEDVPRLRRGASDRLIFPFALLSAVRKRIQERGQYDVVEIHEPSGAWYCRARGRDSSLPPCVLMSHGLETAQWKLHRKLNQALGRKTSRKSEILVPLTLLSQAEYGLKHCQQVMCLNSYDEAYLLNVLHLPPEKISRVQNGVAPLFFGNRGSGAREPKALLFVGSWLERKGRQTLITAFQQLHRGDPNVTLSLIGTGYSEQEVLAYFSAELRTQIRVLPKADDVQLLDAYLSHSIFVFPSYFEPWGLALMEAAAAGMAIVTTCTGGPADLFQDRKNALLVPVLDADALTDAVCKLLSSPRLRVHLGENAQEDAKHFTWRAAAESHLGAYERALQGAARTTIR